MPLDVTLTDEERDRWIQRMAEEVARRRLEVPAVLLLEMHRPLTFLASQALVVSTPFLGALVGPDNVLKLSKLMEDRANLDRLLERIEALVSERDAHSSPAEAPASGQ
jgi:uncharacterized membrane protein